MGRAPSLHRLDGRYPRLRRLLAGRYYERVRLLGGLLRVAAFAFPPVPAAHHVRRPLPRSPGFRAQGM
jgi:hypothetical protein